jgi:hypothetical protein
MTRTLDIAAILATAAFTLPATALPIQPKIAPLRPDAAQTLIGPASGQSERLIRSHHRRHRHAGRWAPAGEGAEATAPGAYGGYVVNQYGYGNYVGGPGGFAGYPAGSGPDFIYRQQENWKCEYAPETC